MITYSRLAMEISKQYGLSVTDSIDIVSKVAKKISVEILGADPSTPIDKRVTTGRRKRRRSLADSPTRRSP